MSHNIATSGAASGVNEGKYGRVTPSANTEVWTSPVLTVASDVYRQGGPTPQVTILFHGGGGFGAAADAHLVVNPWHMDSEGPVVRIEGEDLFALRELLAEFPEEAFKRPKNPVAKPVPARWHDGDVVRFWGGNKPQALWTRHKGLWYTPGNPLGIADREVDAVIDRRWGSDAAKAAGRHAEIAWQSA